jgi:hypothetical protein
VGHLPVGLCHVLPHLRFALVAFRDDCLGEGQHDLHLVRITREQEGCRELIRCRTALLRLLDINGRARSQNVAFTRYRGRSAHTGDDCSSRPAVRTKDESTLVMRFISEWVLGGLCFHVWMTSRG